MRSLAALLTLLFTLLPSNVLSANLDRDWARIYNPPGNESALAMWPSPGGGVDIAADHDGQLVYLKYDQAGNLAAERATGVNVATMWFTFGRIFASDGAGGFLVAARQDSADDSWVSVLRVSSAGTVQWRDSSFSFIRYPHALKVHNGKVHLITDDDFSASSILH